ncbi:LOW QUALITY PROTEIN: sodium channel protein 1 brain-like [Diadema antillarum]|uniref:LOW QUALITY PROTEIN: sodium channel protein 1 brain-like n=1 Tax=Diadema antillarum TaxID=105358 RepID=UPI003A857AEA
MDATPAVITRDNIDNINYRKLTREAIEEGDERYYAKLERKKLVQSGKHPELEDEEEEVEEHGGIEIDTELDAGCVVPAKLGPFPRKLLSTPLEEFDKGREDDRTFVVVARKFKSTQIFRFTTNKGLWCLSPLNPLRRLMINIYTNQYFDVFVMLTIVANCVILTQDTPRPPDEPEPAFLSISEYVFTAIYTVEMVVKIIARGFALHSFTYLRDPWNWLDFLVILLAYITFILQGAKVDIGNFAFLRTFRVLRALKTISVVPGLKSIINALIRSTKMLGEVMLLTVFALCIISLFALQLFRGVLRRKCVRVVPEIEAGLNISHEAYYNFTQDPVNWKYWAGDPVVCSNITFRGRDWSGCNFDIEDDGNYTCLKDIGDNPNNGYTNFDHIGYAMLTCFQLITLDFWENVYNHLIRAQGPFAASFFILTTMFGAFYLINLMLAVVSMAYTEEMENQGREKEKKAREKKDSVLQLDAQKLKRLAAKKKKKKLKEEQEKRSKEGSQAITQFTEGQENDGYAGDEANTSSDPNQPQNYSVSDIESKVSEKPGKGSTIDIDQQTTPENNEGASAGGSGGDGDSTAKEWGATGDEDEEPVKLEDDSDPANRRDVPCCDYSSCCGCCRRNFICPYPHYRRWRVVQYWAGWIVLDPLMDLFITLCIVGNTVFLAMDHNGIPETLRNVSEKGNEVFTYIFTIECVLKLIALDKKFFRNTWNIFDFVVVAVSLLERGLQGVQGLGALRTFRMLRVLKLAQSWSTMRTLLSIIGTTLSAIANVSVVLLIIMFIFAVIGMQLFGASYVPENFGGDVPPWNFTDFGHSFLLVFRILCGEWIEPLYDCMSVANTAGCIILFISTLVVGNIMILNLFLALLLNSFASDSLSNKETEESKLVIAVKKIGRWIMCCIRPCLCCKRFRNQNKVENSSENLKEVEAKTEAKANGTAPPVKNGKPAINEFIVVEDVGKDEDKISTIDIENSSQTLRNRSHLTSNGTHLHPTLARSNGHLPHMYTNGSSRNGSAVSIRSLPPPQPISQAFVTPAPVPPIAPLPAPILAIEPAQDDEPVEPASNALVISTNAETGEMEPNRSINATPVAGRSFSHASLASISSRRDTAKVVETTATIDEPELEDPVKDCLPKSCIRWCQIKCSCIQCCQDPNTNDVAHRWRRFREIMCTICEHKVFETFIIIIIFGSSITLIFEDIYLELHPQRQMILNYLNYVFFAIFVVEMIIKWLGLGFVKYYTSFWCWLDFVIVVISLLSILGDVIGLTNITAFRALRTLRALRPLRAISRWQGMKIVVNALTHAIPSIANVLLVCLIFWLIFSITGVQFFSGRFYRCVDEDGERLPIDIVNNKSDCLNLNYSWENPNMNFDDVFKGYVTLFQVATFEGWMEAMSSGVDARGYDLQPHQDNNMLAYAYFFILIVIGSFFLLNLFIGVIIDNFNTLKRKYEGDSSMDMFLTTNQKQYYQTMRRLGIKKPTKQVKQPTNKIQSFFHKLTSNNKFEILIVSIIMLNMLAMMVEHYQMSQEFTDVLDNLNIFFTSIFTLEAIIKLIALSWYYFKIPWNVFDFIVVVMSLLGIILGDLLNDFFINPTLLRVLRLFRIGRVLRLVKQAKGIRKLLFALVISLPALLNIGILLLLVIFVFSIVGMSQFAYVKKDGAIDDVVNFETFLNSILLLFRLSTSAGWNDVLDPLMVEPPDCNATYGGYPNGNCGSFHLPIFFMLVFLVITFLVVINTYIAVILENFSQAHAQEEVGITEDDFGMFYQVWERYDPTASQFISYEQLSDFCDALEPPLRLARPNRIKIAALDMPIYEGFRLHCLDVLFSLTKRVLADVEESDDFNELQRQMAEKFAESFPDREQVQPTTSTMKINKMNQAAKIVQRAYRFFRLRREISKAASANRAANASHSASRRNSHDAGRSTLDASHSGSLGPAMELPGQLGLSRSTTPMIAEDPNESLPTNNKAEKYQLEMRTSSRGRESSSDVLGPQGSKHQVH